MPTITVKVECNEYAEMFEVIKTIIKMGDDIKLCCIRKLIIEPLD